MPNDDFYRVTNYATKEVFATNLTYQQALDICVELRQKFQNSLCFDFIVEHVCNNKITIVHA